MRKLSARRAGPGAISALPGVGSAGVGSAGGRGRGARPGEVAGDVAGEGAGGGVGTGPGEDSGEDPGEDSGDGAAGGANGGARGGDHPQRVASAQAQETLAREVMLRKLASSARSRAELATAARQRGISQEIIDRVLDRFTEVGLVDDSAYADMFVRSRHASRGLVGQALSTELARKGVDAQLAAAATQQIDAEQMQARAWQLVTKRLASMGGLEPHVAKRRLGAMLARKGYPSAVIYRVIDAAWAQTRT